jgi:HAD superfamily phosphatase (TIGR01668 family)
LVLADLDNTLVAYKVPVPTPEVVAWKDALAAQGIQLFILSNSRKPGRAQRFAQALGVPCQGHSGKPKKAGYLRALERMHCTPEQTVMIGDQIFTDVLGANNAGIVPLLIEPIRLAGNPGRYLRYAVETPFRLLGKRRSFL